jgi:hypothetical protein
MRASRAGRAMIGRVVRWCTASVTRAAILRGPYGRRAGGSIGGGDHSHAAPEQAPWTSNSRAGRLPARRLRPAAVRTAGHVRALLDEQGFSVVGERVPRCRGPRCAQPPLGSGRRSRSRPGREGRPSVPCRLWGDAKPGECENRDRANRRQHWCGSAAPTPAYRWATPSISRRRSNGRVPRLGCRPCRSS